MTHPHIATTPSASARFLRQHFASTKRFLIASYIPAASPSTLPASPASLLHSAINAYVEHLSGDEPVPTLRLIHCPIETLAKATLDLPDHPLDAGRRHDTTAKFRKLVLDKRDCHATLLLVDAQCPSPANDPAQPVPQAFMAATQIPFGEVNVLINAPDDAAIVACDEIVLCAYPRQHAHQFRTIFATIIQNLGLVSLWPRFPGLPPCLPFPFSGPGNTPYEFATLYFHPPASASTGSKLIMNAFHSDNTVDIPSPTIH